MFKSLALSFFLAFLTGIGTGARLLPSAPSLDLKTERDVFKYEKGIGGKFLYWRCDHEMAVFSHTSSKRDSYTSVYYFYSPGQLGALGYSSLPARCINISDERNKTRSDNNNAFDLSTMLATKVVYRHKREY